MKIIFPRFSHFCPIKTKNWQIPSAEEDSHQQTMQNKKHAAYEVTQPAPAAPSAGNVVIRDYDQKKGI
jgi:hypothetical protein